MFYNKPETQKLRTDLPVISYAVAHLAEALRYKPERRGSTSFSLTCVRTMALASAHLLTDMSTRGISWGLKAAGF